jgi:hypothetical protein
MYGAMLDRADMYCMGNRGGRAGLKDWGRVLTSHHFLLRCSLSFAQRAFCAAPMRLLADADMWRTGRDAGRPTLPALRPRLPSRLPRALIALSTCSSCLCKRCCSACSCFTTRVKLAIGSRLYQGGQAFCTICRRKLATTKGR